VRLGLTDKFAMFKVELIRLGLTDKFTMFKVKGHCMVYMNMCMHEYSSLYNWAA